MHHFPVDAVECEQYLTAALLTSPLKHQDRRKIVASFGSVLPQSLDFFCVLAEGSHCRGSNNH
jgi:hypothetical protein